MTPEELRAAREKLGLTVEEAGLVLETGSKTIQRMESPPHVKTHREPPVRVVQLYQAYLAGFRPDTWPVRLTRREEAQKAVEEVRPRD